jgi:hypothetical protein
MSTNPYQAPREIPAPAAAQRQSPLHAAGLLALLIAVGVAFIGLVAGAIWLFYNGYPWLVAFTVIGVGTTGVFLAGRTRREGIVCCLSFWAMGIGGLIGFRLYFALFVIRWFETLFASKDAGLLGLLLFVCGFAITGMLLTFWIVPPLMDRYFPRRPAEPPET